MPTGELKTRPFTCLFNFTLLLLTPISLLAQLVSLPPEELGDWQKAKAVPKKKGTTGKKTVEEEEKEEEEEEDEEDDDEETAEDGGDEEDHQAKEKYVPRPTAHPRGKAPPAPADLSRKRKASGTSGRNTTSAAEKRARKLEGAGTGAQPNLFDMGFVSGGRYTSNSCHPYFIHST